MSKSAKTLMYWISNASDNHDDENETSYCTACARKWAAWIIAGNNE